MCSGKGSWDQEGLRVSDHNTQEYSSVPFSPPDACPISLALGKNPSAFSILESKGPLCMTASETACDSLHSLQGLPRSCFSCVGFGKALLAEFGNYSLERDFPSTESAFIN